MELIKLRYYISTEMGLLISMAGLALALYAFVKRNEKAMKRRNQTIAIIVSFLLLGAMALNFYTMKKYTEVPDVTTLLIDNAKSRLESAEMDLTTVNGDKPEIVREQDPKAGSIVRKTQQ